MAHRLCFRIIAPPCLYLASQGMQRQKHANAHPCMSHLLRWSDHHANHRDCVHSLYQYTCSDNSRTAPCSNFSACQKGRPSCHHSRSCPALLLCFCHHSHLSLASTVCTHNLQPKAFITKLKLLLSPMSQVSCICWRFWKSQSSVARRSC